VLGIPPIDGQYIEMERFASPIFGIVSRGAHMTCYTRSPDSGSIKIWVAKRSAGIFSYPGMLDSTVAGGVKASQTPRDCILAEAREEASLDATGAEAVGAVTYVTRRKNKMVVPTVLHVFDLCLADGVIPEPCDEEVECFYHMTVPELVDAMLAGRFKPNCNLVHLDFLARHGLLPEHLTHLVPRLHRTLPFDFDVTEE
jgi:8-oxo-dGTP pyrophosphatase MutT (NUDIX family)